ncbi:hypothetical protein ABLE68_03565 [Nocardioides sp. CN2-186]|uniref:hypothetical protein n=1 Tax=Nocardioides tweenelious TaxID=3156607 RepID=UPI0032B3256C
MRRVAGALVAAALAAVLPLAPALADSTVVVPGLVFPSGRAAQLSFVGCDNPYLRTAEVPQPAIGLGPDQAPAGERSVGFDLEGGDAVGSLHYVDSMATTTVAGMSVEAPDGASGVAYAGYQEPADSGTGLVWFGRAVLSAPAGGWHAVDVAGLRFTWTKFDMIGQQQVGSSVGAARIPAFVALHGGDGPGFFTIGFGCDGRAFHTDAWRIGSPGDVTTYDLEGLTTATSVSGPTDPVDAGTAVTLHGSVVDGSGAPLTDSRLVLESQGAGGGWTIVGGAEGPDAELTVTPEETTTYRWRFVDRPLAAGSESAPFTVEVLGQTDGHARTQADRRPDTRHAAGAGDRAARRGHQAGSSGRESHPAVRAADGADRPAHRAR